MTRLLHTADTHVGYRQYHSPARRADFLDAFERVIAEAIEADVDAVFHAGDLFHHRRPDLPDLLGTLDALRDLDDAGIPFLAVVGNHEATRGGQWLDLFERFGVAERLDERPRVVEEVACYGLDHVPPSRRDDLDYEFAPHDADHAVLVAHGDFTPFPHADWETERLLAEASLDFDTLLLGDNHEPGTERVDGTWVTYPGSTERASATERRPRGYNLVTVSDDAGDSEESDPVQIRRRTLDTRPFVYVDVELGPGEGMARVRDRVLEHDLSDAVVLVSIEGAGDPVAPARIEEAAVEDGALLARVTDRREVESEDDAPAVSFADPDEAVRERVAEMDLSPAAEAVEATVRDDAVADTNVRERTKAIVEERVAGGEHEVGSGPDASQGSTPETDVATDDEADSTDPDAIGNSTDVTAATNGTDESGGTDGDETTNATDDPSSRPPNDSDGPQGSEAEFR